MLFCCFIWAESSEDGLGCEGTECAWLFMGLGSLEDALGGFFEMGVSTLVDLYREDVDKDRFPKEACK